MLVIEYSYIGKSAIFIYEIESLFELNELTYARDKLHNITLNCVCETQNERGRSG